MNIAVVGLGSMGRRRIRLIKKYSEDINIVGIDLNKQRCDEVKKEFNIITYTLLEDAFKNVNLNSVFISTSPLSHASIINSCLKEGVNVFTELNLVSDKYDDNIKLAKQNDCVLFLSSTFLYRDEVQYIENIVKTSEKKLRYNYHIGQYLSDWHPWEHYKDFFIGNKKTNACREIFAIELPWLIEIFGDIVNFQVVKNNITNLEIDYPDNYMVLIEHKSGHKGVLCVDVVSRKAVRNFEMYGEDVYLKWDGTPSGLVVYDCESKKDLKINLYNKIDKLSNYSDNIIENAYYNEIINFFDAVINKRTPKYSFEKDKIVLDIINKLEGE